MRLHSRFLARSFSVDFERKYENVLSFPPNLDKSFAVEKFLSGLKLSIFQTASTNSAEIEKKLPKKAFEFVLCQSESSSSSSDKSRPSVSWLIWAAGGWTGGFSDWSSDSASELSELELFRSEPEEFDESSSDESDSLSSEGKLEYAKF